VHSPGLSFKGADSIHKGSALMIQKVPPLKTITFRVNISKYGFREDTNVQTIATSETSNPQEENHTLALAVEKVAVTTMR
jgi:hypothetical protein